MNITLTLDDDLVKEVRKIAVDRDTTLTGLVRAHLEQLAAENAKSGRKRRESEALPSERTRRCPTGASRPALMKSTSSFSRALEPKRSSARKGGCWAVRVDSRSIGSTTLSDHRLMP